MTIQSQTSKAVYIADGNTNKFNIPFYFFDKQISVFLNDNIEPLEPEIDYTISNNKGYNGGEVTMISTPAVGEKITIVRNVELTQLITFLEGESFPASDFEYALDKIVMALQQMRNHLERCVTIPNGSDISNEKIYQLLQTIIQYQQTITELPSVLAEVSDFQNQFSSNLNDYYTKSEIDSRINNVTVNKYTNVTALVSNITKSNTYDAYPYRLEISLRNVTSTQIPTVNLAINEAVSGNIAPIAQSYDGGIYLYLKSSPENDFTIPSIIMH